MLTVVVQAASTNLTTTTAASNMLGIPEETDGLGIAIAQASGMIADHCRRPFGLETVREIFRWPRSGLLLARAPAISFVSVDEGGTVLTADDYELDGETLFRVSHSCRLPWVGPITVTYAAGYVLPGNSGTQTLPAPVERAAILVAGAILTSRTRDPMMRSENIDGVRSVSWWVPDGGSLPSPEAETLLAPYRRIVG